MAYIGKQPLIGNFIKLDAITASATDTYNLLNDSVAYTPQSAMNCIVSLNGVIQAPITAYTIVGTTIVFSTTLSASDTIDFIIVLGDVLDVGTVSDDTISTAKIKDLAVTTAKVNNLAVTNAKIAAGTIDVTSKITGVVPTANLGSGSASSSTFLRGDQTYAAPSVTDIAWQAVTTGTTLTAVAGRGYPINTTSNVCTVTLPASASVGDQIIFTDYARTWNTYAVTLDQGSLKFQGYDDPNPEYDTAGESVHIVYMDATQGWVPINDGAVAMETPQTYSIDFLVVAGGGSGASNSNGGGGGAGGYRTATESSVSTGIAITITVGDGGAASSGSANGTTGSASSFSGSGLTTISTAGGGGGGGSGSGLSGGSGGGSYYSTGSGGAGNTPSTSPVQGYDGGDGAGDVGPAYGAGGGGGASEVGYVGTSAKGGDGGDGVASSISGSSVTRGGGGGGGTNTTVGSGGAGGGGAAVTSGSGVSGTVNTGGGGGACESADTSGAGGKGVVILSMPDADYSGTTTGSPTVATGQAGSKTTLIFTGTGSYTT